MKYDGMCDNYRLKAAEPLWVEERKALLGIIAAAQLWVEDHWVVSGFIGLI